MAVRTGHGAGAGVPRVEVLPPDELPVGVPADARPGSPFDRGEAGRFARGNGLARSGGLAKRGTSRLTARLGLPTLPDGDAFAAYRRAAATFRRVQCADLSRTVGGGMWGPGPSSVVASAALTLAWNRYFSDQAAATGDPDLAMRSARLGETSRQHLLAAHELAPAPRLIRSRPFATRRRPSGCLRRPPSPSSCHDDTARQPGRPRARADRQGLPSHVGLVAGDLHALLLERAPAARAPRRPAWRQVVVAPPHWRARSALRGARLPPGDVGIVGIVSVSRDEAAQRLRTIKAILDALGVKYRPIDCGIELEARPIAFKVFTASISGVVGGTWFCGIGDELARWRDADTGANPATEVLGSLRPTMAGQPGPHDFPRFTESPSAAPPSRYQSS
jgi:hypothetical protein